MEKSRDKKQLTLKNQNSSMKATKYLAIFAVIVATIIISIIIWRSSLDHNQILQSPSSSPAVIKQNDKKTDKPSMQKLVGQWRRPDGGYVINVHSIDTNGQMDVSYLNPRPINVSRAEALYSGNTLEIFIELWDENYPGSTYQLKYDPLQDILYGNYFIPVGRQNYQVYFNRLQ